MEMHFCRRCGTRLDHIKAHIYECAHKHIIFANANPSVIVWLLNREGEVLVTRRGLEPGKGKIDCPGGFIDGAGETAEQAVIRELKEELDLEPEQYSRPKYLTTTTGWYEYKGEKIPTVDLTFYAIIHPSASITPQDDVTDFTFAAIPDINQDAFYLDAVKKSFVALREQVLNGSL